MHAQVQAALPKPQQQQRRPDVETLSRALSIKTLAADVQIDLRQDAARILQASKEDALVRSALESLQSVRHGLEAGTTLTNPDDDTGVQDYCAALGGLASHLASGAPRSAESALLCCQMFISIEQARGSFLAMAQHLLAGLRVMHDLGARPGFAGGAFVPARSSHLPKIDVFIIKMKAAPCRFTDYDTTNAPSPSAITGSGSFRTIVPDTRATLVKTAHATIALLDRASKVQSADEAVMLLPEKAALLHTLASWPADLALYEPAGWVNTTSEQLTGSFMRHFHIILKIVLLSVLDSRPGFLGRVKTETDELAAIATNLTEGVRRWKTRQQPNANS